ncbi:phosphoribosylanthranilate isomerase [Nocardioides alkalitolerans]|uniref:phosphoribosylanthranilate isomerase n=1 Tax=Nocardioides alkalitolerans TaxID=281714 RepID=UPI0003F83709|nr:phosphoribosylanthranilate isomerase [Nocardioides alkalitolerans]
MYVKICGLDTPKNAAVAVAAGADAVGVVVCERSPRHRTTAEAATILGGLPAGVDGVLVVADLPVATALAVASEIGADVLQLHGAYGRADVETAVAGHPRVWWATTLAALTAEGEARRTVGAWGEDALLLDAPVPGAGERWDLAALDGARPEGRWLLAGGLGPDNVADAVRAARPWGVDVSSGVEGVRGVKDPARIRAFVEQARLTPGG